VYGGKEAAAIHSNIDRKHSGESPLLPSPLSSHKPGVIPNSSTKKNKLFTETLSVEE
jgi:hypothetical protein